MAIKEHFDNLAWTEWPDADARARKASTLKATVRNWQTSLFTTV